LTRHPALYPSFERKLESLLIFMLAVKINPGFRWYDEQKTSLSPSLTEGISMSLDATDFRMR